jgi:SAM-dependent methyltransferase
MNPYNRYVLPWVVEKGCGIAPVSEKRRRLIPRASGRVLEVGVGTGHNLPFYSAAGVTEVIALDPAEQMQPRARERAEQSGVVVRMLGMSAERIPLEDDSVDTVVTTFTLCSIPDPATAVSEMRRVLRPGGRLLFAEHGRAPTEGVRRWQRRLEPIQKRLAGGCHLGRDMPALLGAEFELIELDEGYLPGPKAANYLYTGVGS